MIKQIKNGLIFGITAGLSMLVIGISYAAWTGLNPESGDTLTVTKWNELVARTEPVTFKCSFSTTGTTGWNSKVRTSGDCEGYLPSNYNYCNYSVVRIDGTGMTRGIHKVFKDSGYIHADSTAQVILETRYMCWN